MTVSTPKWSVLICTIGKRQDRFLELLKVLMPQVLKYNGDIEVVAYWNNGELSLGEIRQALVMNAQGEYISFIDDDDQIPKYYCEAVHPLLDGVDYIGWQMQLYHNGEKVKPTYHSLRYPNWFEDEKGYYRDISHLNPIKRQLVLEYPFTNEKPEDGNWVNRIRGNVKSEHYIDKNMYDYIHVTEDSYWAGLDERATQHRPIVGYEYFRWHPSSKEIFP